MEQIGFISPGSTFLQLADAYNTLVTFSENFRFNLQVSFKLIEARNVFTCVKPNHSITCKTMEWRKRFCGGF